MTRKANHSSFSFSPSFREEDWNDQETRLRPFLILP